MKLSYSVSIDGTKQSIGPFPFAARSITIVNQTGANAIAQEDGGAKYTASPSTSATYGVGNTTRFLCYVTGAQSAGQTLTVIVSDEDAAVSVQQLANLTPSEPTLQIARNGGLVGTEPTLDFEDGTQLLWVVTDDAPNGRVKVVGTPKLAVQHNGAPVATEAALDFVDAVGSKFTVSDDAPNGRVRVAPAASPVRMLANGGSIIAQNTVAETTIAALTIPAGGTGTNGFGRLTVQGLFQNNTGVAQNWPELRYWITVAGIGSTLLIDTGSIAAGGGVITSGAFFAWKAVLELHNVGGTGAVDANITVHGGSGGGATLGGTFTAGFGTWLSSAQAIIAEGNAQGIAADTTRAIQIVLNAINPVASVNYLISARYSQLEVCEF